MFASGLRNPNGLGWEPKSGALWTVVNERDELGSDLVPDYLTSVKDGGFYGWPWSYFGQHVDRRVQPERPDMVAKAIVPDYALGAHVAPLGLAFYEAQADAASYAGGAFIGQHGSWNRRPLSGYNVVFVPFAERPPFGQPGGDPLGLRRCARQRDGATGGRGRGRARARSSWRTTSATAIWRVTPRTR